MVERRTDLRLRPVTRDKLALFLPNQELIRAFENLMADVMDISELVLDLQIGDATTAATLAEALSRVTEQPLAVSLDELREQVAALAAALQIDHGGAIAALREEVAAMNTGNKRKRAIRSTITMTAGNASGTYTISPALESLDLADLRFLGASNATAAPTSRAALTNTTTVTATRGATAGDETISFEITEYLP